jgi:transposase
LRLKAETIAGTIEVEIGGVKIRIGRGVDAATLTMVLRALKVQHVIGPTGAVRVMVATLPEDQMLLGLEDVEQTAASDAATADQSAPAERAARAERRRINRGSLPAHLPRLEIVVDIDDKVCPCCQGELHRIGEDKSERLDIVPAQFRMLVTRRPKYACRACEDGVVQAPARLIEGGLPTEATLAQVLVSKYADHLPLYRQAQIYARQGIALDRSTLADWVGHAAWHLHPLQERLLLRLKERPRLFADETTAPVSGPRVHQDRPVLGLRRRRPAMGRL